MKKFFKWIFIIGGCMVFLSIAVLFIIPMVVNVEKFKPVLEKRITEATGRPFSIKHLNLSLFPSARVSFSGLHMENPVGFSEKDFLVIKSLDLRVKLVPLLRSRFKDIQVDQFGVNGIKIVLEKNKDGSVNWHGLGRSVRKKPLSPEVKNEKPSRKRTKQVLPFESITGEKWVVQNGSLVWIDHQKSERREISNLEMVLKDVSLDRPIQITFSTLFDGKPFSFAGRIGPIGKDPGRDEIFLDMSVKAFNELNIFLVGQVIDPRNRTLFDINIDVRPFSGRRLLAALDPHFSITTSDPETLNRVSLKAHVRGDSQTITFSKAALMLDETETRFSLTIKDVSKPDISFNANIDKIDLDRYLPFKIEHKQIKKERKRGKSSKGPVTRKKKKRDYTPLRKLVLAGKLKAGGLKIHQAELSDIRSNISAKNGLVRVETLDAKLYDGKASAKATLDFQKDVPRYTLRLETDNIQTGPLLRDVLEKDILECKAKTNLALATAGDHPNVLKKNLNGQGEFILKDGVIKGIDLAAMIGNVESSFDSERADKKDKQTEFTELRAPIIIRKGIVHTSNTTLKSPTVDANMSGKADLNTEVLDFRVEPRFLVTREKKGKEKNTQILVPILVSGSFSNPKFRPDLSGIIRQNIGEEVIEKQLKKIFKKEKYKPYEEAARELLKKLLQE